MRSRRSPSVHIPGSAILPSVTISSRQILRVFFFAVFARILMADTFYHAALSGCTLLFRCVLPVATGLYLILCQTCVRCLTSTFHNCFLAKSASFSDAKIVCSRERPPASAIGGVHVNLPLSSLRFGIMPK